MTTTWHIPSVVVTVTLSIYISLRLSLDTNTQKKKVTKTFPNLKVLVLFYRVRSFWQCGRVPEANAQPDRNLR